MAWKRALIASGLGLAMTFSSAPGEERESVLRTSAPFMDLQRGDPIRVRLRDERSFRVRFITANPDTLAYSSGKDGVERRIPFQEIEGLDRRSGSHGHVLTGAILGLVGGAALGAAIGAYAGKDDTEPGLIAMVGAVGGAAGGVLVGSFAGMWIRTDEWTPVYEP